MTTDPNDRRALLQSALSALDDMQAKLAKTEEARREPIAIVGMGCRLPGGANSPDAFWQLLCEGRDAVRPYPAERQRLLERSGVASELFDAAATWYGGFLDDIDLFDAGFFGISPREAASMDPQQRMVLEVAGRPWRTPGIAPDRWPAAPPGCSSASPPTTTASWQGCRGRGRPGRLRGHRRGPQRRLRAGGLHARAPGPVHGRRHRVLLVARRDPPGLPEPALGESDLALAGGVNLLLLPEAFVCFNGWGMMAPTVVARRSMRRRTGLFVVRVVVWWC